MELNSNNRQSEDKRAIAGEDVLQQNFTAVHDQPPQYEPPQQGAHPQQGAYPPQGAYPQQGAYPPQQHSGPSAAYPQGAYPPQQQNYSPYPQTQGPYIQNQQTVVVQTGVPVVTEYVETYMAWSIINCLFCCWILGIVAIIMSSLVSSENGQGNVEGARKNSRAALGLNIAATATGIVTIVVLIAVCV